MTLGRRDIASEAQNNVQENPLVNKLEQPITSKGPKEVQQENENISP